MCDQTEITYDDGEVVWVRLGFCWWPGQVTGFENLPEDLQIEFKKKSLIAAVKFFQEDTFELVKNISQIFKYNCTKKEEFIRKGLDKYRSKSKDGSTIMNKFPGDVQMAETLTGGNPDIINDEKFIPQQKPNIASLFGEKKPPKKKRDKDEHRKSMNDNMLRQIPQNKFHKEHSDHEVRIRKQPTSLQSTPEPKTAIYRCSNCSFTSKRINVIICHNKSHRTVGWEASPLSKSLIDVKSRSSLGGIGESPKRKYTKKNKSFSGKLNLSRTGEPVKRKHSKQLEKSAKKKKPDPEIHQLLADWDDASDEDMDLDTSKSTKNSTMSPSIREKSPHKDDENETGDDLLKESDKFLNETEKLTMYLNESTSATTTLTPSKSSKFYTAENDSEDQNLSLTGDNSLGNETFTSKKLKATVNKNNSMTEDNKSKLSCFDFNEEEPEPAIPPVRKVHRVFSEKNMSLKKEIIKEFAKSQALQNEKDNEERQKLNREMEAEKSIKSKEVSEEKQVESEKKQDIIHEELEVEISEETRNMVDKIIARTAKIEDKHIMTEMDIIKYLKMDDEDEMVEEPKLVTAEVEEKKEEVEKIKEDESKSMRTLEEEIKQIVEPDEVKSVEAEPKPEVEPTKIPEFDTERVTIEEDDDTLPISQLSHASSAGTGGLSKMGWSQLNEIIGGASVSETKEEPVAEVKDSELTPQRRGRGRPRKNQLGVRGNGDSISDAFSDSPDRKISETESERSYSSSKRKPKPNKKYLVESETYYSSPGGRTPRTDDSQSETEEKPVTQKKGRRGRKLGYNKSIRKSLEEYEFSDQTLDSAEESTSYTPVRKSPIKSPEFSAHVMSPVNITDMLTSSSSDVEVQSGIVSHDITVNLVKDEKEKVEMEKIVEVKSSPKRVIDKIDMLPPKKSQIKKFELSQMDLLENASNSEEKVETVVEKIQPELKPEKIEVAAEEEKVENVKQVLMEETTVAMNSETVIEETVESIVIEEVVETKEPEVEIETEVEPEREPEPEPEPVEEKKEETVEIEVEVEKGKEEEKEKEILESVEETKMEIEEAPQPIETEEVKLKEVVETSEPVSEVSEVQAEPVAYEEVVLKPEDVEEKPEPKEKSEVEIQPAEDLITETIEVIVDDKETKVEEVIEETVVEEIVETREELTVEIQSVPAVESTVEVKNDEEIREEETLVEEEVIVTKEEEVIETKEEEVKEEPVVEMKSDVEVKKPEVEVSNQEPTVELSSVVASTSFSSEESVPVKKREKPRIIENIELKDPMPILKSKNRGKRGLDLNTAKKLGLTKSKLIKIDPKIAKSVGKVEGSLTQKVQVLKQSESKLRNPMPTSTPTSASAPQPIIISTGEKIQQSAQNLEDMEFDINSMSFILSDDLPPEQIQQIPQMPVIATVSPVPTPATSQTQPVAVPETITVEDSPKKKPSPAILKTKAKAKPTITSITKVTTPITKVTQPLNKTVKLQNSPDLKNATVINPKGTPSKFVFLQSPGGAKINYTLQSGYNQKMVLPAGKIIGNTQVIQNQGDKVYILSGGQSKMLPLNVPKDASGKVQRLVLSKAPITYQTTATAVSPKGSQIIVPKTNVNVNVNVPTTSKLTSGQKIINASGVKGLLTPISSAKTTVIGLNSAVMKNAVYTTTAGAVKSIMNQKAVVKGSITSPNVVQGTSKASVATFSPTAVAKSISSSTLIPGKNTVLKPMTGTHLKAMAAKSPNTKTGKPQAQLKGQVPILSKCQKVPVTPTPVRSPPGMIILQNPVQQQQTQTQTQPQQNVQLQHLQQKPQPVVKKTTKTQTLATQANRSSPQLGVQHASTASPLQRSKSITSAPKTPGGRGRGRQKAPLKPQPETIVVSSLSPKKSPTVTVSPAKGQPVKTQLSPRKEQLGTKMTQKFTAAPKVSNLAETLTSSEAKETLVNKVIAQAVSDSKSETQQEVADTKAEEKPKQLMAQLVPNENNDAVFYIAFDEHGEHSLNSEALMAIDGATQNPDGTHTIYIQTNLDDQINLNNLVFQLNNGAISNVQIGTGATTAGTPSVSTAVAESETIPTSNHDILATAVANTVLENSDFQQEIGIPESVTTSVMNAGLTQTSLNNQTILQSTIIPTSEPISSPLVSETSLTLNQPIMAVAEYTSNVKVQENLPTTAAELPMIINSNISCMTTAGATSTTTVTSVASSNTTASSSSESSIPVPGNSMPDIGDMIEPTESVEISQGETEYLVISNVDDSLTQSEPSSSAPYAVSISESSTTESQVQITPSMPIIDDSFVESVEYSTVETVTSDSNLEVNEKSEKEEVKSDNLDMPIVIEEEKKEEKMLVTEEVPREVMSVETIECSQSSVVEIQMSESETVSMPTDKSTKESSDISMNSSEKMEVNTQEEMTLDDKSTSDSKMEIDTSKMEIEFSNETSQEAPSQSFKEFDLSIDIPSQSKSENSREPSQSVAYEEPMEIDETVGSGEPPTQSFKDIKSNEASQSYETAEDSNTNIPTQSFKSTNETDSNFPTQSYEIEKVDKPSQNVESESEISQEGNIPSQSNDIGTSSNNVGLNEDETASSSYVPETPEAQERDQDQESAISTSSYEISPCDEINIASSTDIPDTSARASEHSNIHDNGVPEIPTSSYNLNPDSSSAHVDTPTSSFEDQVVIEQNVSTSYEVPISMPGLEENSSQNFVSESTTEPSSYYPEDVTSEASQSYFVPEGTSQSSNYYEPPPESEASQSFYSQDIEKTSEQSSTEATQSFYQESSDELRLQGEATPTYIERYPVDYTLENSPIERHDLVESSVPATKPAER